MEYKNLEYVFIIGYDDNKQLNNVLKNCEKKYDNHIIIEPDSIQDIQSAVDFYNIEKNDNNNYDNPKYVIFAINLDERNIRVEWLMDYYEDFINICYDHGIGSQCLLACKNQKEIDDDQTLSYIVSRLEDSIGEDMGLFNEVPNKKDIQRHQKKVKEHKFLEEISKGAEIDIDIQSFGDLIDSYVHVEPLLTQDDKDMLSAQVTTSLMKLMNELTKKYKYGE